MKRIGKAWQFRTDVEVPEGVPVLGWHPKWDGDGVWQCRWHSVGDRWFSLEGYEIRKPLKVRLIPSAPRITERVLERLIIEGISRKPAPGHGSGLNHF